MLRLLKARSVAYRSAQRWQLSQLVLVVMIPFVAGLAAIFYPLVRPYTVSLTVILTLLDALLLDRQFRHFTKRAAIIGDQFDTNLFKLPWNYAAAGPQLSNEAIIFAADSWIGDDTELCNRYPASVDLEPLHVARVLCQRSGVWYDAELRKGFSLRLVTLGGAMMAVLTTIGVSRGLPLPDWLLSVLAPSTPILIWIIRENFRMKDAAEANEKISAAAEKLLDDIKVGRSDETESRFRSRDIQTAVLARRTSNPWVPRWLYRRLRPRLEPALRTGMEERLAGADEILDRASIPVKK